MTVNVNDVVRASVHGVWNSSASIDNVYHFRNLENAVSDADAVTNIIAILEGVYAFIGGLLSVLYVVQSVELVNVTQDANLPLGLFTDDTPGSDSGSAGPLQVAYGISLSTARRGSFGRKFFAPVGQAKFNAGGVLTSTALAALANVGDFMSAPIDTTESMWEFGIVSTEDGAFFPFNGYAITLTGVTQRRRRIGVGE